MPFDEALILALRTPGDPADPLGPGWIEAAARDVTALGGWSVIALFTLTVAGYLLLARRPRTALLLLIAWVGAEGLSNGLKLLFGRPRPDLVPHAVEVTTASLPSGHALLAMAMYLSFAALIPSATSARPVRVTLLVVAVLLALLIGVSRIYLGVHWPSDVLAGWAIGAAWTALVWWASRRIGERGSRDS